MVSYMIPLFLCGQAVVGALQIYNDDAHSSLIETYAGSQLVSPSESSLQSAKWKSRKTPYFMVMLRDTIWPEYTRARLLPQNQIAGYYFVQLIGFECTDFVKVSAKNLEIIKKIHDVPPRELQDKCDETIRRARCTFYVLPKNVSIIKYGESAETARKTIQESVIHIIDGDFDLGNKMSNKHYTRFVYPGESELYLVERCLKDLKLKTTTQQKATDQIKADLKIE